MADVRSKYTNMVQLKLDRASLNKTRKDIVGFRNQMQKELNKLKVPLGMGKSKTSMQPRGSPSSKPALNQQEKFLKNQDHIIDKFMHSNKLVRQMNREERNVLRTVLKSKKTQQDLSLELIRQRGLLADKARAHNQALRKQQQQLVLQRRLNSSTMQLVGSLASVYTIISAGGHIVRTGAEFESLGKSMLVSSKNAEEAKQNFAFVRQEAMRLGVPLNESAKAFNKILAAAGDKISLADVKEMFVGINESAVALGLTKDDINGVSRALTQMVSRLLGT